MRIADMLARSKPSVSFEFMAPRDESEVETLEQTIAALAGHAPDWVSVTYRVRTGERTLELVTRIKRQHQLEAMAHLTCANTADRTRQVLNWMEREGVANVLALRGDPPAGEVSVPSRRSLKVMSAMSGATIPAGLLAAIDDAGDDDGVRRVGVEHCIAQCAELLEAGVPGIHFYTFNRARAPIEILAALRGH